MMRSNPRQGFTLFIAVITVSIVLAIGISILNIMLKELTLSSTVRESRIAFYAADAAMECAQYWDQSSVGGKFNPTASAGTISCMGGPVQQEGGGASASIGGNDYGDPEIFQIEWGSPAICAHVSVTKYHSDSGSVAMSPSGSCPQGVVCTVIESQGYNRACDNLSDPRTVERALRSRY